MPIINATIFFITIVKIYAMNGIIYELIASFALVLGQDGIFVVFISLSVLAGIINLLLACLLNGYGVKKRVWYPFTCLFLVFTCGAVCNAVGYGAYIPMLVFGISALINIPVFSVRVKTFKVTEQQRSLVKFIDEEIKLASKEQEIPSCDNVLTCRQNDMKEREKTISDFELDFQHVKSVIARLDYFGLKDSDKKQVKELENALFVAEKGDFSQEIKTKINDGLGALLKIMSKYGV